MRQLDAGYLWTTRPPVPRGVFGGPRALVTAHSLPNDALASDDDRLVIVGRRDGILDTHLPSPSITRGGSTNGVTAAAEQTGVMTSPVTTVGQDGRTIARRVTIDAPASVLFELVADPHRHHEFDGSGTVTATVTGPTALAQGDTFTVAMKQYGAPYKIKSKVVALQKDRLIEWKHPAGHTWRWQLEETTPGTTQVTETWDATGAKPYPIFKLLGVPGKNARGITKTLEGLQARFS